MQGLPQSVTHLSSFTSRFSSNTPSLQVSLRSPLPSDIPCSFRPLRPLHVFPEMPFSRPLSSQWTINPINEWRCSRLLTEHLVIHSFFLSQHLVHSSISTNLPVLSFIYRSVSPSLTLTSTESTFPRVSLDAILFYLFYLAFWPCHAACGILVPQPGI